MSISLSTLLSVNLIPVIPFNCVICVPLDHSIKYPDSSSFISFPSMLNFSCDDALSLWTLCILCISLLYLSIKPAMLNFNTTVPMYNVITLSSIFNPAILALSFLYASLATNELGMLPIFPSSDSMHSAMSSILVLS